MKRTRAFARFAGIGLLGLGGVAVFAVLPARPQEPVRGKEYARQDLAREDAPPELITTRVGQIKLKRIPAGTFLMGSPDGEGAERELPQHRVRITKPFYLGVYDVTQAQYEAVVGVNPSWFPSNGKGKHRVAGQSTERHPVENVSWLDAVTFCNKLSELEGRKPFYEIAGQVVRVPDWNGPGYRLPTEAEWEYACRAGTQTRYSFGDGEANLGEFGWLIMNAGDRTHPGGEERPNGFGLFDMHGNVWEGCWDGYSPGYYDESPANDPRGHAATQFRVSRGGTWSLLPPEAQSATRTMIHQNYRGLNQGFRLARGQSVR